MKLNMDSALWRFFCFCLKTCIQNLSSIYGLYKHFLLLTLCLCCRQQQLLVLVFLVCRKLYPTWGKLYSAYLVSWATFIVSASACLHKPSGLTSYGEQLLLKLAWIHLQMACWNGGAVSLLDYFAIVRFRFLPILLIFLMLLHSCKQATVWQGSASSSTQSTRLYPGIEAHL